MLIDRCLNPQRTTSMELGICMVCGKSWHLSVFCSHGEIRENEDSLLLLWETAWGENISDTFPIKEEKTKGLSPLAHNHGTNILWKPLFFLICHHVVPLLHPHLTSKAFKLILICSQVDWSNFMFLFRCQVKCGFITHNVTKYYMAMCTVWFEIKSRPSLWIGC